MQLTRWMKMSLAFVVSSFFVLNNAKLIAQVDSTEMVPSSAMAAVIFKPKDALAQPGMELIPREVITAFGKKELGFDPCEIKKIMGLVDTFDSIDDPPHFALLVEFASPQKISEENLKKMRLFPVQENGRKIFRGKSDYGEALYELDANTFVLGAEPFIKKMLAASGAKSGLIDQMIGAPPNGHLDVYVAIEPVRALIEQQLPPANRVPPPFAEFLKLPRLIDSLALNESFAPEGTSRLTVDAVDDSAAQEVKEILVRGIGLAKQMLMAEMMGRMRDEDPVLADAMRAYLNRIADYFKKQYNPEINGNQLVMGFSDSESTQLANVGSIGVLIGMLLPAVQSVREAARRTQSANQLRQFAIAALNYESAYQLLPAQAICSEDGKPLLSWRVMLLPFMEQNALYEQFKLDEPWDSPHNIKLLEKMPEIYRGPNSVHSNKTVFLGVSGEGTMFDGRENGVKLGRITDGTSKTIFFVEVNDKAAVEWTKPSDYSLMEGDPLWGLRGNRPNGFNAAFVDGSIHFIRLDVAKETMLNLMRRSDGNAVRDSDF